MIHTLTDDTNTTLEGKTALQYLIREPKVATVNHKAIILLHGVGSNENDLFNLAPHFPDNFIVISPRGPLTLSAGRYAWYEVDFSTGKPVINAGQEAASRAIINTFIKQVKDKYNVEEVYLGGFSQGAIMSYNAGLTTPDEVNGIIALSGRLLNEVKPFISKQKALQQLKVFIAHGTQDSTLPVQYARDAKAYLQSLGVQLSYHEYNIGHQINADVLNDLVSWLN